MERELIAEIIRSIYLINTLQHGFLLVLGAIRGHLKDR